jgi:hypothetical protein
MASMATFSRFMFLLAFLLCLSVAVPLQQEELPTIVWPPPVKNGTLPEKDDFYKAPAGFEKAAAGTILRYRRVPGTLAMDNNITVNVQAAWQLQYRTQNSVGDPEASIVTVLVPRNHRPGNLFMYAYYTVCSLHLRLENQHNLLTYVAFFSSHLTAGKILDMEN